MRKRITALIIAICILGTLMTGCGREIAEVASEPVKEVTEVPTPEPTEEVPAELTKEEQIHQNMLDFYELWKAGYIFKDEYVTDEDQYYVRYSRDEYKGTSFSVPVTVSEAHGYGMLILANMSDYDPEAHDLFDGMVRYYNAHRSSIGPHLMSWMQADNGTALIDGADDGEMEDGEGDSATDGDMDVAYALLLADKIWGSDGEFDYKAMAIDMINDIMEYDVNHDTWMTNLGDWSYDAEPGSKYYAATRPSDFIMTHMPAFYTATGDERWLKVYDSTYEVIEQFIDEYGTGLLPDFMVLDENGKYVAADAFFLEDSTDGQYAYNSCRTPWRIGLDYVLTENEHSKHFIDTLNSTMMDICLGNPNAIVAGYTIDGEKKSSEEELCFTAPFLVIADIGTTEEWETKLRKKVVKRPRGGYYGDSIKMICLIIDADSYKVPYTYPSREVSFEGENINSETLLGPMTKDDLVASYTTLKNQLVYSVGTIHDKHLVKANHYSLSDLQNLVSNLNPDYIFIESRPVAKQNADAIDGPLEMIFLYCFAEENNIPVRFIDSWEISDDETPTSTDDLRDNEIFKLINRNLTEIDENKTIVIFYGTDHFYFQKPRYEKAGWIENNIDNAKQLFENEGETFTYPGSMKSEVLKSIEYYTEDLPEEIEEKVGDREIREEYLTAASQKVEALQGYLDLIEG